MSNSPREFVAQCASSVRAAIDASGKTKMAISEHTGIPYATLNRKLAGKSEFSFSDLLLIAEELHVSPANFTPSPFRIRDEVA